VSNSQGPLENVAPKPIVSVG